ncbi:MAG: hydantoinase B/oxoprolinase family protein [Candidatus Hydrogenedentes bacterium]|nr:hydantoinase B/oxoprolinase family protein [Candidatus Hydrogenedentota bacterium]
MKHGWHFWIDRGGTFTDVVARDPAGALHTRKLLSVNPGHYEDAPLQAIRDLLGLAADAPLDTAPIAAIRMGTTLATNALLERKGAPCALLVTRGFADLLEIGYQNRPALFALHIVKPTILPTHIVEADERLDAQGDVIVPLDTAGVRASLQAVRDAGIASVAILFLHSYRNPVHERIAGQLALELGFTQISLSHEAANEIKAVGRGDTVCADASLTPLLRAYVDRARAAVGPGTPLHFMQSSGGLARAERFSGKDAILSGPAGGVVACEAVCRAAGYPRAIGFDMGGTSTDVSRVDGASEMLYEKVVAGVRIKAPMTWIETVAAGGGSIMAVVDGRLVAGPESAGAFPGPACYGRGGPATVTDANLVLGRIQPRHFPRCFGSTADAPLDRAAAHARFSELAEALSECDGRTWSVAEAAAGAVRIANLNMAKPIKEISVARGYDVQDYVLACFGGAGGQHACAVARELGMRTILIHPLAGVLSAWGMGLAPLRHSGVATLLLPLSVDTLVEVARVCARLCSGNLSALQEDGVDTARAVHEATLELRYTGVESTLSVPITVEALEEVALLRERFEALHQQRFGFVERGHAIEVATARVVTLVASAQAACVATAEVTEAAMELAEVHFEGPRLAGVRQHTLQTVPVHARGSIAAGQALAGPALIIEPNSTIVVEPGWRAMADEQGNLILTDIQGAEREDGSTACDPVRLEIFNNLFMSVAEQMGQALERASHSANIKERLDFSCALFSPGGGLIANAPHIPVHLGAMGESVKAVLARHAGTMRPGDVYVTNNPYEGGSHLPDVTVVTPVFSAEGALLFAVANRGHHADIGGITPGSMPPFSKHIDEEGIVIDNLKIVSEGVFNGARFERVLSAGPHPARNLPERGSDLRAQIAANATGVAQVLALCRRYTIPLVHAYMDHVRANAAAAMGERLRALPDGVYAFSDAMDDGAAIQVRIEICGGRAVVDFTGSAPQHAGNLNAPPAVVVSAVLYVFRTLIDRAIPLNAGCLEPITIINPPGTMLHPAYPAAVVGGNVETSQRICDVLYGALGAIGAGQGTMNNFTFGNAHFGYYETICGGAGAGDGFHGASGVHVHMTNTRITDPEVLEHRYPVRVRQFALRRGSGGQGRWHGGDGAVREIEFLEAMTVSLLTERRSRAPYGMAGGGDGKCGVNTLIRGGVETPLGGHATVAVAPGDCIRIETPGGGGYGCGAG